MFLESFKIVASGVGQGFILAAIGFFLIKRNLLGAEGLDTLSRLVIEVTLPLLIFVRLVKGFSFGQYPDWWLYMLVSLCVTIIGIVAGYMFSGFIKGTQEKTQFISLIAFQNSGYLPLVLVASILPAAQADAMFIYLFLFLVAFNLLMFSVGVYLLTYHKAKKFDWMLLLNPPVIATLIGLAVVWLKLSRFIPAVVLKPLEITGDCTVPLAMMVLGGNIAVIKCSGAFKRSITLMALVKLVLLPCLGLWMVYQFRIGGLLGFMIVLQLAMPSATNLSVIVRQYRQNDCLVSQGVFYSHIISIITIPVFLSLYFMLGMLQ
ncbi:MAG: AEC family transporter [Candidatus Omnitrophota bacterium]